jgi:hypothetical protein
MLHKVLPQCLTARQQTVMGVRERKQREEREGLPATAAATAPNPRSSRGVHRAPACGDVRDR